MDEIEMKMDRRTFMKSTLAAGAGVAVAASMGNLAWGKSYSDSDLADLSLYELSKMIRTGEITSQRLVEIYLDRIQKYDGLDGVNAYITVASDAALKTAQELDKSAKLKNIKGPLHGLPIDVATANPAPVAMVDFINVLRSIFFPISSIEHLLF
jgi:hypothetical protein